MRVVQIYDSLHPRWGGPPPVVVHLSDALRRLGHQVTLVSSDPPGDPEVAAFIEAHARVALPRLSVPGAESGRLRAPGRLVPLVGLLREADVVHLHGVWNPLAPLIAGLCRVFRRPLVVASHGMLTPWALGQKPLKKRIALSALGFGQALRWASALQTLNADESALYPAWVPRPPREFVVPNGVDPERLANLPPAGTFRATHPELGDAPYVLFLSRLHPEKGLDVLVEAMGRLDRDAHCVIAGPDYGARADTQARIARLGLDSRVWLVGALYGEAKLAALRDAAVFCLPSRHEGFSVAITEALAVGLPCVISRECHFPEVAEAGAGLVVGLDAGRVAEALDALLADPRAAKRMGDRGRALVEARFTWDQVAARVVDMYRAVGA